jgi:HAD superfamily hydrolase (TIGR01509 family)
MRSHLAAIALVATSLCHVAAGSVALSRLRGGGGLAFEAALFDFDGTLCQSEGLHRLAFSAVLGIMIDETEWERNCVGTSPASVMANHLPEGRLSPGETIDDLLTQRSEIFEQWIDEGKLDATGGARELLEDLKEQGVRCAVVSSGSRAYIVKALDHLGLSDFFETIVAGDDEVMRKGCPEVGDPHHKPHPFPYLHATARLGVEPRRCVAFEDSLSGIKSAQAAGMPVVAIRNANNAALPVVPAEEPCPKTGIEPLMELLDDFDALDRRFLF